MSAKRQAHAEALQAAERAEAEADASAARTWPISVHLTPFARGCERMRINDSRRWRTFYGRTVEDAVRSTLARLRLAPAACRAGREGNGDTAMLSAVPPELLRLVSSEPGAIVPFALFWDGVTPDQLKTALNDLTARGWKPPEAVEA